jgi:GPH family glycoside/pentoside/hexuronide:cation symporter
MVRQCLPMPPSESRSGTVNELRLSQQLGWAAGSLGTAIMLGALTSFGLFFMTTHLGIGALLAGQIIGLSKLYGVVADPLVGSLSDRSRAAGGRRRPFLRLGMLGCPAAVVLLFANPPLPGEIATAIYLAAVVLVYATAFSLFNVPYLAMPAEMTGNPRERTLLMSQRMVFSTLGVLAISVLGPALIRTFGGTTGAYTRMSWVMALIALLGMGLAWSLTAGTRTLPPSDRARYGMARQLRLIGQNRPFRVYMAAKICLFISQTAVQGTLLFFARHVLGRDESLLAMFGVGYTVGSLAALPLWTWAIRGALGKRNGFMISAVGLGITFLTWLAAGPAEPTAFLYGRFVALGIFSAGSLVSGAAMLPDIMEYDRRATGINQEGLYAAAFSMVEKFANTLGPMLTGTLLGLTGFIATKSGETAAQPQAAITAIHLGVSVVPCVLALAAAWTIRHYDLDARPLAATPPRSSRSSP